MPRFGTQRVCAFLTRFWGCCAGFCSEVCRGSRTIARKSSAKDQNDRRSNWKELDGPDAAELMEALGAWMGWINERHGVTDSSRILGCWYRHTAVVEELTAAWVAWRASYYGHNSAVTDAAS